MSDDEIEIVDKSTAVDASLSGTNDVCQLCSARLHGLSVTERHRHYSGHASVQTTAPRARRARPNATSATTPRRNTAPMKFARNAGNTPREDVFWYPTQAKAPPDNYTPGALPTLKEALKKSHRKGATQRALLCYERTPHIFHESFDSSWGCGYRNFLMACAALMVQPAYAVHLNSPSSPGIRRLQQWIEDAWKEGYDDIGAHEFDRKLVNTKKKLGTGDLYVAFTSRKIPCMLVDFNLRKSSKGFDTLTEWVVNYFTEKPEGDVNKILRAASPIVATDKMPVILQYDGHSVTIVGYELGKNGKYNLLVFNPSSKVPKDIRQAALDVPISVDGTSLSPTSLGKGKRRELSTSPAPNKRTRTNEDPNDGVISIPDSDDEQMDDAPRTVTLKSTPDPDTVIKAFRLKGISKKKQDYQLLYFTMGNPLSDQEQNERKIVFSVVGC